MRRVRQDEVHDEVRRLRYQACRTIRNRLVVGSCTSKFASHELKLYVTCLYCKSCLS
jgi:hypothetical protein